MPASLLTLNTTIPSIDNPGTPVVVVFDNGDWEIAFAGDVDYIEEGSNNFHSHATFIDVFISTMIHFDMGDADDLDESDGVVYLMISETVETGDEEEPVLLVYQDGETDVMERYHAEKMIETDPTVALNFIPLIDLFEDFRTFRSRHDEMMFGHGLDDEDEDEDADPEDI